MRKCILLVLVLLWNLVAQEEIVDVPITETEADYKACLKERRLLCKEVKPGEGRLRKCFLENEKNLSTGCRLTLASVAKENKEFQRGCKEDRRKFCSEVKPGSNRIIECLDINQDKLSASCKTAFEKVIKRRKPKN